MGEEYHFFLGKAGRLLRNLARQREVAVVITNWMVSSGGTGGLLQPALGEHWRSAVHTRLLIEQRRAIPDSPPSFYLTPGIQKQSKDGVKLNLLNQ